MDFSDLPQAAQDGIAAAELEADSILKSGQATAGHLASEAYYMGVDPSGVGYSPGDIPIHLARLELAASRDQAAAHLFGAAAGECLIAGKLDIARLDLLGNWMVQRYGIDHNLRDRLKEECRIFVLRRGLAALNARKTRQGTTTTASPWRENPFPEGTTAHQSWKDMLLLVKEHMALLNSEVLETLPPESASNKVFSDHLVKAVAGIFDAQAGAFLNSAVPTDDAADAFEQCLLQIESSMLERYGKLNQPFAPNTVFSFEISTRLTPILFT